MCFCRVCGGTDAHPGDVNLADHVLLLRNIFVRLGDEDAFALAPSVGLTDVGLVFLGSDVSLEVAVTVRRDHRRSQENQKSGKKQH